MMSEDNKSRRQMLKGIGVATALGTPIIGSASAYSRRGRRRKDPASSQSIPEEHEPAPGIKSQKVSKQDLKNKLSDSLDDDPVDRSITFLKSNWDCQLDLSEASGVRVTGAEIDSYVSSSAPIYSGEEQVGTFGVDIYENSVKSQFSIHGYSFFSPGEDMPGEVEAQLLREQYEYPDSISYVDENVVPLTDYLTASNRESRVSGQSIDIPDRCLVSKTFPINGGACLFIAGFFALGSTALILIPEPSTSAAGAVILTGTVATGILTGTCSIGEGLEQMLNLSCDLVQFKVCIGVPTPWEPNIVSVTPAVPSPWECAENYY